MKMDEWGGPREGLGCLFTSIGIVLIIWAMSGFPGL